MCLCRRSFVNSGDAHHERPPLLGHGLRLVGGLQLGDDELVNERHVADMAVALLCEQVLVHPPARFLEGVEADEAQIAMAGRDRLIPALGADSALVNRVDRAHGLGVRVFLPLLHDLPVHPALLLRIREGRERLQGAETHQPLAVRFAEVLVGRSHLEIAAHRQRVVPEPLRDLLRLHAVREQHRERLDLVRRRHARPDDVLGQADLGEILVLAPDVARDLPVLGPLARVPKRPERVQPAPARDHMVSLGLAIGYDGEILQEAEGTDRGGKLDGFLIERRVLPHVPRVVFEVVEQQPRHDLRLHDSVLSV